MKKWSMLGYREKIIMCTKFVPYCGEEQHWEIIPSQCLSVHFEQVTPITKQKHTPNKPQPPPVTMVLNNINHHHEAIQSMNQGVKGKTITYMHTHIYIRKLLDIPPHLMTLPSPQTNISTPHAPILHPTPHSTTPTPQYPTPIDITPQHIPHEITYIIRMYWSNIMYALKLFNEGNLYDLFIFYSALYYVEGSAWVCYCWNDGEGKLIKYHKYLIYIRKIVQFDLNLWNHTLNITMCHCH